MKTFRDEETGERYRAYSETPFLLVGKGSGTVYHIEPVPKPPQTEAEIVVELAGALEEWILSHGGYLDAARAIVAAMLKIVEVRGK